MVGKVYDSKPLKPEFESRLFLSFPCTKKYEPASTRLSVCDLTERANWAGDVLEQSTLVVTPCRLNVRRGAEAVQSVLPTT